VGVRISKSFKVAPGVRFRVNAKSTSLSIGGKGMRHTVNSKGRRTTTVRVPGTGMSVQQISGTRRSGPRQHPTEPSPSAITSAAVPKPGPSASRGEKRLYKVLVSNGLSNAAYAARCEQVAEKFPDQRIAAATLAGLFSLTENPTVAIRTLGYVVDSGVEIAEDPFLRRYSPVKAYAMDAGGGLKEWVPLSSALVVGLLATVYLVAGHVDQAETTAAVLTDTPVTRELRRKIAAARGDSVGQTGSNQAVTSERSKQVELLERVYASIADLTQSRDRIQSHTTVLEQQMAKLEQQMGKARQFGREDLAQEALTRLKLAQGQVAEMKTQVHQLLAERAKLTTTAQALQAKIDGAGGLTVR
jgi:Protein of unknown function (DUF4236)